MVSPAWAACIRLRGSKGTHVGYTPGYNVRKTPRSEYRKLFELKGAGWTFDAVDTLRQLQAMMQDDVASGASLESAAERVRARLFVLVSLEDHMVNPEPAIQFGELVHARIFRLNSDCGHMAVLCIPGITGQAVSQFLKDSPSRSN